MATLLLYPLVCRCSREWLPSFPFVLGDLAINYVQRRVTASRLPALLTLTEFDMLTAGRSGGAHDRLLRRVWSPGKLGTYGFCVPPYETTPQVGRRRSQSEVHLRRASHRPPDAQVRDSKAAGYLSLTSKARHVDWTVVKCPWTCAKYEHIQTDAMGYRGLLHFWVGLWSLSLIRNASPHRGRPCLYLTRST